MTYEDRAVALERLGYTPRQARFLVLVALHSGYFLRRQYVTFIGRTHGAVTVTFLREVLRQGHATATPTTFLGHVYHLKAKAIYTCLGQENNRNRRLQGAANIRRRLMALDLVLAHRDAALLGTEEEKLAYFSGQHGLPPSCLPSVLYRSTDGASATRRYFVEKFPIVVWQQPPRVGIAYIDDDEATADGFTTFFDRYRPLVERLRIGVDVIFVTTTPPHVDRAKAVVNRRMPDGLERRTVPTLLTYVRARQRLEQRTLAGIAQQELDALRHALASVAAATGDAVYRLWCAQGDVGVEAWVQQQERTAPKGAVTLTGHVLPFTYGVPRGAQSYRG